MNFEKWSEGFSGEDIALMKEVARALAMELPPRTPNNFDEDLIYDIYWYWQDVVHDYRIDHEHLFTYPSYEIAIDDPDLWEREIEEVKRAILNHKRWIADARQEFRRRTAIYYSQLAKEKEYLKHFSNSQWTRKEIEQRSHQRALLIPKISYDKLDKIFVEIVNTFHFEMYLGMAYNFIAKTQAIIGFSEGRECRHLLYKIDETAPIYHVYPINDNELKNYINIFDFAKKKREDTHYTFQDHKIHENNLIETRIY